jgi:uncharacterized protein YcfL
MKLSHLKTMALIGAMLALVSCRSEQVAQTQHPATLDTTDVQGIMKVTLEARAAERIGLQTGTVSEERVTLHGSSATRRVIPYGALMYDKKGHTWTFTEAGPLAYVRQAVEVEDIQGDRVILSEGPAAGTVVVTVGAAELMGAEHKYGH